MCCAGEEWVCLASDEGCVEASECLDLFPGTCPISLSALVVFVIGTAGCVMVIIIFFTRTHHPLDNVGSIDEYNEDESDDKTIGNNTEGDILLAEISSVKESEDNDIVKFDDTTS